MLDVKNVIFEGLAYTLMGIVVVFAMLLIIMYVIKAMQLFSSTNEKKPKVAEKQEPAPEIVQAPKTTQQDSTELIAVITAAIAAAMGKSSSDFVVRSFKKLSGDEWGKTGRREILENRF